MISRSTLGKQSRNAGKTFERLIARLVRAYFDGAVVRRSLQSERAYESDVVVEGDCPSIVKEIWWECGNQKAINPERKLAQAELDASAAEQRTGVQKLPLVVWKQKRKHTIWVTCRLGTMLRILGPTTPVQYAPENQNVIVTAKLHDLLEKIRWLAGR